MLRRIMLGFAATGAVAVLWAFNCSGPLPSLEDVRLRPPEAPGQPYTVEASIANRGPGKGQVDVKARLHDDASGRVYEESRKANLEPRERIVVALPVQAPEGAYRPDVEVEYPPR